MKLLSVLLPIIVALGCNDSTSSHSDDGAAGGQWYLQVRTCHNGPTVACDAWVPAELDTDGTGHTVDADTGSLWACHSWLQSDGSMIIGCWHQWSMDPVETTTTCRQGSSLMTVYDHENRLFYEMMISCEVG